MHYINQDLVLHNKYSLMAYAWKQLLNKELDNNYNLLPIHLLKHQKEMINNLDELKKHEHIMDHFSKVCEEYFMNKNNISFVNNVLEYLIKMIICNGIELIIRKIFVVWLRNTFDDYNMINNIIDMIFNSKIDDTETTLLNYLYKDISKKLLDGTETTNEILLEYFELLQQNSDYLIPENIKDIFDIKVVGYFDLFVSKTIKLWKVNIENIFKYFINYSRCLKVFNLIFN